MSLQDFSVLLPVGHELSIALDLSPEGRVLEWSFWSSGQETTIYPFCLGLCCSVRGVHPVPPVPQGQLPLDASRHHSTFTHFVIHSLIHSIDSVTASDVFKRRWVLPSSLLLRSTSYLPPSEHLGHHSLWSSASSGGQMVPGVGAEAGGWFHPLHLPWCLVAGALMLFGWKNSVVRLLHHLFACTHTHMRTHVRVHALIT